MIRPVAERLLALLRPYVRRGCAGGALVPLFFRIGRCFYELLRSRAGVVEEDFIDRVYLVLRYLHSRYVTGNSSPKERALGFHMGVGVDLILTDEDQVRKRHQLGLGGGRL